MLDRTPRPCATCGETFTVGRRGSVPTRCRSCAAQYEAALTRENEARRGRAEDAVPRYCGDCGEQLVRRVRNGPWPTFCSPCVYARKIARNAARSAIVSAAYEAQSHACSMCGEPVARKQKAGPFARHCESCLPKWKSGRWYRSKLDYSTCVECEQPFEVPEGFTWRKRCVTCHERVRADQVHDKRCRRRARIYAVPYRPFSATAVFELAGWVCALCGDPVNRDATWPDPEMPSLDHVVPLARGGSHTKQNAQLAHLGCNIAKGAAIEYEDIRREG